MPGNSNKNALLSVAAANEICSYICYQYSKNIFKFHPLSIRATAGLNKKCDNIKLVIINYTCNDDIFQQYLNKNNLTQDNIFPTRIISKGKRKGQMEFISGASDIADSFVIGITSQALIKKNNFKIE